MAGSPHIQQAVRLKDVASKAGVAVGTASRVLSGATNVSAEVIARVNQAVDQLAYRPLRQRAATAKRDSAKQNLGLVMMGMADSLVHVPVLTEVLHGIESQVMSSAGNLLLANLPTADRVPAFLQDDQVAGVLIKTSQYLPLPCPEESALARALLKLPRVWLWARPDGADGDLCTFNHESAAMIAAAHLRAYGHRRVAYLNPKQGKSTLEHMKKEFLHACRVHGLESSVLESQDSAMATWPEPALTRPAEVEHLVDSWLAIPADARPTAAFVPADNIATFVYRAIEARGLRVGRDLSLVSCNNEKAIIGALQPELTTIEVHARNIGSRAVDLLLRRISRTTESATETLLIEPKLQAGNSVARIGT